MSCCGSSARRPSLATGLSSSLPRGLPAAPPTVRSLPLSSPPTAAMRAARVKTFEYTGSGELTVRSSITGRKYHFGAPGARQTVELPDWTMMFRIQAVRLCA